MLINKHTRNVAHHANKHADDASQHDTVAPWDTSAIGCVLTDERDQEAHSLHISRHHFGEWMKPCAMKMMLLTSLKSRWCGGGRWWQRWRGPLSLVQWSPSGHHGSAAGSHGVFPLHQQPPSPHPMTLLAKTTLGSSRRLEKVDPNNPVWTFPRNQSKRFVFSVTCLFLFLAQTTSYPIMLAACRKATPPYKQTWNNTMALCKYPDGTLRSSMKCTRSGSALGVGQCGLQADENSFIELRHCWICTMKPSVVDLPMLMLKMILKLQ